MFRDTDVLKDMYVCALNLFYKIKSRSLGLEFDENCCAITPFYLHLAEHTRTLSIYQSEENK